MKIRLLGTGAADGIPAFTMDSEVSRHARQVGGKEIRSRCGALIDDVLKLDLPPDTLAQCQRDRVDPGLWTGLVFSHSHDDHFAPREIQYFVYPFNEREFTPFTIYGNAAICSRLNEIYPEWPIELVETRSFQCFRHGDHSVTPIRANHKLDEDSHNLIVQGEGKTFLYGTDTGVWEEPTWAYLSDFRLDGLVLECTEGFHGTGYAGHLDIYSFFHVIDRLRKQGTVHDGTFIATTHHSALGQATHAQLESVLRPHGIEPGFDGMVIEL
ncbi:MAG TPA: MBL fold metallo-hydrolase [Fimbriimonadaceae bacterium]|nr:MBL fold metallo-hydrolase [Fimbriimonadaceae bacterium]